MGEAIVIPNEVSSAVLTWWAALSLVSVVNLGLWILLARDYFRRRDSLSPEDRAAGRRHLLLGGIYVVVCAFRSFVPRADVQRICFVDSFWASIFVGRTVATIAEVSFMIQLVWTARRLTRELDLGSLYLLVTLPLPMILIAETCSWYAVLTTNYAGNFIEESLWMLSGAVFTISLLIMRRRVDGRLKRMMSVGAVMGAVYVSFMMLVDVRMYFSRLGEDTHQQRSYMAIADGLHDAIARRVVTFAWNDWHEELAWMFLYFSVTVWLSLFLVAASHRPLPRFAKS
jgi:hypothetical protein